MTEERAGHYVAVIGGATAGAEVASRLADRGVSVFVFEQNGRPYGKIEDGLPRWHEALRKKEYHLIDEKLSKPGVSFIPNTKIGEEIGFSELVNDWGFSAVVLANGAWRDRGLPIEGADEFIDKGRSSTRASSTRTPSSSRSITPKSAISRTLRIRCTMAR